MRPFSSRMFPDRVALASLAETRDTDSGVVEVFGAAGSPLPCRVHYVRTTPGYESGTEADRTTINVGFPADPGAKKGDRIDPLPSGPPFRALGAAKPHDADGALFVLRCLAIE